VQRLEVRRRKRKASWEGTGKAKLTTRPADSIGLLRDFYAMSKI
jgi:hypothetical protein